MPECVLIISVVAIAAYVIYQGLALGVGKVIADIASSLEAV
ncbi:MAG TPA: hypothetical protein VN867_06650 [Candidatus Binataceae bacterium]|nr:hypothetical protein [Candidatus Binataceae bacterium]